MTAKQRRDECVRNYGKGRQAWYREAYLSSVHWLELRALKLSKHGRLCDKCGFCRPLDVHHLNYRHIFDVTLDDLQCLCRPCHDEEHGKEKPTQKPKKPKRKKPHQNKPKFSKSAKRRHASKRFQKGVKKAIKARGGIVKDPWKAAGEVMAQMLQTKTLAPKQHRHHFRGRIPLPPESHSQGPYIPPPK